MPYSLSGAYRDWIKRSIERRYRLMPYYHTLFYESAATGLPVIRPLFLEFADDSNVLNMYEQFMLGDALLLSPILNPGTVQLRAYFPYGLWFDLWSGQPMKGDGSWHMLEDIPYQLASHMRAGTIIPLLVRFLT